MNNTRLLTALTLAGALAASAVAAPLSFDFKDPKGVNAIQFSLDSLLEPIAGTASGITGTVTFDPAAPNATTGTITVAADSLIVPNDSMTEHMHGAGWIDVATHPIITFTINQLSDVTPAGRGLKATAHGTFTLKGVSKDLAVPVTVTHLPDALGARTRPENKGDLLVVRGEFTIERGEFGIKPGENEDKVASEIKLSLAIVGSAPKA
jgi:polyisoprenoid-binding protein YceI